ncbi:MAG: MraY family glycosyltransferase [Phycisphaerae bacterium]|jgi:UDP-GlcNAc:undecaprenyl-phosphate GlcNAc-1-phosphate transferase|nr:MraY family glycosyltransferase [Phycisphaerae bacterium]
MKTYIVVFAIAMIVAMLTTPLVIWLARRTRVMDEPGPRKIHQSRTPRLGGLVILIAVAAATIPVLLLHNRIGAAFHEMLLQILAMQAAGLLIFIVGLIDDVVGLRARHKLLAQVAAALVLYLSGTRIDSISLTEDVVIELGWLSLPATILWVTAITNAVNLIDGLDGLAAGISAVACGVVAVIAMRASLPIASVFMLAFLGSLIGFLVFNFNPAKIFLGDCGSLFLGFVLAGCSMLSAAKYATVAGLGLPLVALGVPLFDTFFSMLRRILERRSLFAPDRRHIHHRLLERGLAHRQAVLVLYGVTLTATGAGMLMMITRDKITLLIFAVAICFLICVFHFIGAVRLRDSLAAVRRNMNIAAEMREEKRHFETLQLLFREAASFEAWWSAVSRAAEELGFSEISLVRNGSYPVQQIRIWRCRERRPKSSGSLNLVLPLTRDSMPFPIEIKATLEANSSIESAGRRITLFSRLFEELDRERDPATHLRIQHQILQAVRIGA